MGEVKPSLDIKGKQRVAFTILIILFAFVLTRNLHPRTFNLKTSNRSETINPLLHGPEEGDKCILPTGLIFLKKHKTASTTFRAMTGRFNRYAGLTAESQLLGPQGGCYPARFNERCWPSGGHRNPIQGVAGDN